MSVARAVIVVLAWAAALSVRGADPVADGGGTISPSGVPGLESRLELLSPTDPLAYFELGEEVAYEIPSGSGRELARRLYVLAFELDLRREEPLGLGGSVCLALADLSVDVSEQRWLRALAEALEGASRDVRWSSATSGVADRLALDLAEAMGRARAGDTRELRTLLGRFDVATFLRDSGMKPGEATDFARELEGIVDRLRVKPPSREERRVVGGELIVEIDAETGGNPGPSLDDRAYLEHVRVEMLLLGGQAGTWASQLLLDDGAPLRDVDPSELAAAFGVDASRCVWERRGDGGWREGAWVEPGGGEGEEGASGG